MYNPNYERPYIRKSNNAGLVTTTGGNDLLHTLVLATAPGTTGARSAVITKIMAYNPGANATLRFGTLDRGVPTFVQLLPTLVVIGAMDNEWTEFEIPPVEFMSWPQLTAAGRIGDIYVVASIAAIIISLEVKEYGG